MSRRMGKRVTRGHTGKDRYSFVDKEVFEVDRPRATATRFGKPSEDRRSTYQPGNFKISSIDLPACLTLPTRKSRLHRCCLHHRVPRLTLGRNTVIFPHHPRGRENKSADRVEATRCPWSDAVGLDDLKVLHVETDSSWERARVEFDGSGMEDHVRSCS